MNMQQKLPRRTPESQGLASATLERFVAAAEKLDSLHSLMVLRHGNVIAEGWFAPYRPECTHQLFSLSKSFTSVAIGLAEAEGVLTIDDKVADYFPDKLPENPDPRWYDLTIRHLLSMTTGHAECAIGPVRAAKATDWVRGFFSIPLTYAPGERFVYNTGATYMLSAILRKMTGQNLSEFLRHRLFEPLDIGRRHWDQSPDGTDLGGWGFHLTTEGIAKFAQLLLQDGRWGDRQLLPYGYLRQATGFQADNSLNEAPDWKVGYGFQFWKCRHGAFRADGAMGQYAVVMPEQDMVVVATSGLSNMQNLLDLIWEILLPAVQKKALGEDAAAQQKLAKRLAKLALPAKNGQPGDFPETEFDLDPNANGYTQLTLAADAGETSLSLAYPGGKSLIRAGYRQWLDSANTGPEPEMRHVAARADWKSPTELHLAISCVESPYQLHLTVRLDGEKIVVERESNLEFWDFPNGKKLTGRRRK